MMTIADYLSGEPCDEADSDAQRAIQRIAWERDDEGDGEHGELRATVVHSVLLAGDLEGVRVDALVEACEKRAEAHVSEQLHDACLEHQPDDLDFTHGEPRILVRGGRAVLSWSVVVVAHLRREPIEC